MGWLVTVVLGLHFAFLAYLLLGGFLAWRWPWTFWPHAAAVGWGVLILTNLVQCPLTMAEGWARKVAGYQEVQGGFIDRYVTGVIYPGRYVNEVRAALALVVLAAWVGAYRAWRSRRDTARNDGVRTGGAATV
ncbi:MAG TPA: DUF2784 domain-containing protein [Candidatus Limnocylindria bacterium]|nr:DUF2784 domain-containing protein [Candidatus Limnocylindria bacterium]